MTHFRKYEGQRLRFKPSSAFIRGVVCTHVSFRAQRHDGGGAVLWDGAARLGPMAAGPPVGTRPSSRSPLRRLEPRVGAAFTRLDAITLH